ncbi:MAG TPA: hypothetical protein VGL56_21055 [Fimbriimonadaceae bacterium]
MSASALFTMLAVALIPAIFMGLIARDCSKELTVLKLELKAGNVKKFSGPKLDAGGLGFKMTPIPPGTPGDFEVLSGSGRLWRTGGLKVNDWVITKSTWVSSLPKSSIDLKEKLRANLDAEVDKELERELTSAERKEIVSYARTCWIPILPFAIGLTAYVSFLIGLILVGIHGDQDSHDKFMFGFLVVLTVLTDYGFIGGALTARKLLRDQRSGKVVLERRHVF